MVGMVDYLLFMKINFLMPFCPAGTHMGQTFPVKQVDFRVDTFNHFAIVLLWERRGGGGRERERD